MLKNIRLHIEKNEEKQAELDNELASKILDTHKININAFQRNIPSLVPLIKSLNLSNYSIFINKFGETNIVDYGLGRTFYGFHPEEEVYAQLAQYQQHCPEVLIKESSADNNLKSLEKEANDSSNALEAYRKQQTQKPLPDDIECLVVLGCGLGLHILPLLTQHRIKNLIIYEPEIQFFQCAMMTTPWQDIFIQAKANNTAIFLQLEKDGRDVIDDIKQLAEHASISSFHLYKHYNHTVFESLYSNLCTRSWGEISQQGLSIKSKDSYLDYIPSWTPIVDLADQQILEPPNERLFRNLETLKSFFPDIYEQYKDYKPQKWQPFVNSTGEVNLIKIDSLHAWYSNQPRQDCILNFESFNEQPNKDGLVLGYNGTKLAHYIHYQFVKETEELLKQSEEEVGALPDKVASIIMFGLGVGYQLEKLLKDHTVEKLFICEPNPDFFYASLFAIDWQTIFETIDESDARIYLNIGDDGTNLFQDLLSQFHSIGPYILNSTYFYQSYYNASLNSAISQLREQLQVVISMGEYFDHAYYGIEHTKEGLKRNYPHLVKNPATELSYSDKETPIFIVGNGPSLDQSINAIKEWQERVIVVSCGTALQALHRNNITPDFHAEIEQNRATYDWAALIGDFEYLKRITLISCNGIHPDTCDLYKDVFIAFKEGESSTVSALSILGEQNFETLKNSFPTVSNLACDLFDIIGFNTLYLLGVDLGFVDVTHHHSKSSDYYHDDGKQTYDYSEFNNTSLRTPGNFRPTVNTKREFKISKQILEQVTNKRTAEKNTYNCSDGAKINNSAPVHLEDLLIVSQKEQKEETVHKIKTAAFSTPKTQGFLERYNATFSHSKLESELSVFEKLLSQDIDTVKDLNRVISQQKDNLFASYQQGESLLFYYLYGTINYANAILIKLNQQRDESDELSAAQKKAVATWVEAIKKIKKMISNSVPENFDTCMNKPWIREILSLEHNIKDKSVLIISDDSDFKLATQCLLSARYTFVKEIKITSPAELHNHEEMSDYVIQHKPDQNQRIIKGAVSTLIIKESLDGTVLENDLISYMPINNVNNEDTIDYSIFEANLALKACLSHHQCGIIFPKYVTGDDTQLDKQPISHLPSNTLSFEHPLYFCIYVDNVKMEDIAISASGSRGKRVYEDITFDQLRLPMTEKDMNRNKILNRTLIASHN